MFAVEFGNLSRSDGSALVSLGDTLVQAAVYGPTESKINKELCDKAVVEVSFKPKIGLSGCKERMIEAFIRNSVELVILAALHPRTSINIIIQEIQDSGNILACSVNAACLALLDAGIPMKGTVAATSVSLNEDGTMTSFPSLKQIKTAKAMTVLSVLNTEEEESLITCTGCCLEEELEKCVATCKLAAKDLFSFYKDSTERRYSKSVF